MIRIFKLEKLAENGAVPFPFPFASYLFLAEVYFQSHSIMYILVVMSLRQSVVHSSAVGSTA